MISVYRILLTVSSQCRVPESYCEYISMRWGNEPLNTLHCHGDTFAHKVRHISLPFVLYHLSRNKSRTVSRDLIMHGGFWRQNAAEVWEFRCTRSMYIVLHIINSCLLLHRIIAGRLFITFSDVTLSASKRVIFKVASHIVIKTEMI